MASIKNILAVYDPTRGASLAEQPAVERAAELARQLDASLEIFVCVYNQYLSGQRFVDSPGLGKSRETYIKNRHEQVRVVAEEVRKLGIQTTTEATWDTPLSDGIVRRVLKRSPDLVVKDTHRHAKFQRVIFTNTDWHLLRDCPAPLLLVKPGQGSTDGPVIAAVDPLHDFDKSAELDRAIIDMGRLVSECQGLDLHLFHAYQTVVVAPTGLATGIEPIMLPLEDSEERIKEAHARELDRLRKAGAVAEKNTHLVNGDTHSALLELVGELDASIVVMGVVARGALQRLFIGSTAEQVLGDVDSDVLVVKQAGFKSHVKP